MSNGLDRLKREIANACADASKLSDARKREPGKITKGKVRAALERAFVLAEAHMYASGEWDRVVASGNVTSNDARPLPYQIAAYADTLNVHIGEVAARIKDELQS
jgi:hypothetical protein